MVPLRKLSAVCGLAASALVALTVWPDAAGAGFSPHCKVPDAYLKFSGNLDRTEARILRKRPVRVLILAPAAQAVQTLEAALERRLPGASFDVSASLSPGLAEDDFERMRTIVSRSEPDLVIWAVGTGDALASSDIEDFEVALDQASDWIDRQGPDLVFVDPPFVPHVRHERLYVPFVGEIEEVSKTEAVPVIRRYASMQYLSQQNAKLALPPLDQKPCVAEIMAEAITRSVQQ
jgi:acyl-CoA thioesterase-1